jgi:hypothetical protein
MYRTEAKTIPADPAIQIAAGIALNLNIKGQAIVATDPTKAIGISADRSINQKYIPIRSRGLIYGKIANGVTAAQIKTAYLDVKAPIKALNGEIVVTGGADLIINNVSPVVEFVSSNLAFWSYMNNNYLLLRI